VQFVAGYGIAFWYSWKMTLVMMIISPLVAVCGVVVGKVRANTCDCHTHD
jgi:ABC-type multidrug transport system fused ATPase/permease subunit